MSNRTGKRLRATAAAMAPALAALLLGACAGHGPNTLYDHWEPQLAYQRYPITVARGEMRLEVRASDSHLSAAEEMEIARFAHGYLASARGPLVVTRPAGAGNEMAAAAVAARVTQILAQEGVGGGALAHRQFRARGQAPVVLSYGRLQAISPECGDWSQNAADNYANDLMPNLGCAQQHNLAAMVADPNDFVTPRTSTPPDAARRNTVMDKYRQGLPTATEKNDDDKADVAKQEQN